MGILGLGKFQNNFVAIIACVLSLSSCTKVIESKKDKPPIIFIDDNYRAYIESPSSISGCIDSELNIRFTDLNIKTNQKRSASFQSSLVSIEIRKQQNGDIIRTITATDLSLKNKNKNGVTIEFKKEWTTDDQVFLILNFEVSMKNNPRLAATYLYPLGISVDSCDDEDDSMVQLILND